MKRRFSKKIYKSKRRGKYVRKTRKNSSRSSLKRTIKKIVMRNSETKHNNITVGNIAVKNYISTTEVVNIIPDVAQGTGQASRIGNRITPTKFIVRFNFYAFNLGSNTPPTYYDIYIFKFKGATQEGGRPADVDMQLFLQNDNSAEQYLGRMSDGLRSVNKDLFTLCVRRRIMLYNPYNTTGQISSTAAINPNRTIIFDLTKHIKSTWMYDDNSTLLCNDSLYVAVGASQVDGVQMDISFGSYLAISELSFKDS